jgi:hypothetical protein
MIPQVWVTSGPVAQPAAGCPVGLTGVCTASVQLVLCCIVQSSTMQCTVHHNAVHYSVLQYIEVQGSVSQYIVSYPSCKESRLTFSNLFT